MHRIPPVGCTEVLECTESPWGDALRSWGARNPLGGCTEVSGCTEHSPAQNNPVPSPSLLFLPYRKHTGWLLQMRKNYSSYRAQQLLFASGSLTPPRQSLQRVLSIFYLANVPYYYHDHNYYYLFGPLQRLFTFTLAYSTPARRGCPPWGRGTFRIALLSSALCTTTREIQNNGHCP